MQHFSYQNSEAGEILTPAYLHLMQIYFELSLKHVFIYNLHWQNAERGEDSKSCNCSERLFIHSDDINPLT